MTSTNIRKLSHSEMDLYRKPLLPETWSCFPVDKDIDTQQLRKILQKDLDRIRSGAEKDPFSNSITMLALDISRRLEKNKLNYSALEALIQRLAVGSFGLRADRLKSYMGTTNKKKNIAAIRKIVRSLAYKKQERLIDFKEFNEKLNKEIFGIVLTAHPTFGMTYSMMMELAKLSTMTKDNNKILSDKELKAIVKSVFKTEQRPEKNITLDFEHSLSISALKFLQQSLKTFYKVILEVSKEFYPNDFHNIKPQIFRLHSWVGYDVDGRGDISWNDSFSKRLEVKIHQLVIYHEKVVDIERSSQNKNLRKYLIEIKGIFKESIIHNTEALKIFSKKDFVNDFKAIKKISNYMFKNKDKLLTNTSSIISKLDLLVEKIRSKDIVENQTTFDELIIFKIEILNFGLGLGRTHFRLNANQLNNAISKEVDLSGDPNDPSNKITYLSIISKLIDKVKPVKINFGSIFEENMNARRYFMLTKQILKYIDENQSIRFLIAECDYPLSVMTALYFSKLFGVEKKIDISPLFETEKGLEIGHDVIRTLLRNNNFKEYILSRKKLTVQTGFSDAGRYLGQSAAVLSIENLQRKIARALHDHNMPGVKLLIFNTHGESIGRGGHPVSLIDRLKYVNCDYTRKKVSEWKIELIQEMSFQGGDGYQYFMNHDLALASISRIIEFCLGDDNQNTDDDPLYKSPDFGIEFVNTIKNFNTEIMDDPNYATLLNVFGSNLTHSTGSRTIKRHTDSSIKTLVYHPSQTRAIPQNSILQQLGMLANSLGGIGRYIRKDSKNFLSHYNKSERFKRIMDIVQHAFAFSDIEVLKAYIDCFDPGMWLSWSTRTADSERSENMKEVANLLEKFDVHWRLHKVYRQLHQEYMEIRNWILGRKLKGRIAVGRGRVIEKEIRDELLLMHGIRVAIFHEIFLLSVRVPKFSDQAGTSRDEIIAKLIRFDILDAVETLRRIFPAGKIKASNSGFSDKSNYVSEINIDYTKEEKNIFKQLEALYECARRVSTGITHFIGSVG
ncbi:MAG: phosphoenolpyruvate carboxylase [Pseudomonadota bacterium]|nr:phosphoenolpyruvate carboxylase [Pseudomonadota bacterium]